MPINLKNLRKRSNAEIAINPEKKRYLSYRELAELIKGKHFSEAQGIVNSMYDIQKLINVDEFNAVLRKLEKNLNDSDIMLYPE